MSEPVLPPEPASQPGRDTASSGGPASVPPSPAPPRAASTPADPAKKHGASASASAASDLVDGEWHRMHPLTPLLKGGLFLIVVAGVVVSNFRDRLIAIFLPEEARDVEQGGDPVEWILENNLVLVALGAVLVVLLVIIGVFYLSWRFHTFRITRAEVEVRKGILQRKHTKAPLDRVQGVNLTRPFMARMIGLAKLEVVGAGTDANVQLEHLTTPNAERVRSEILRLASGARARREAIASGMSPEQAHTHVERLTQTVSDGITGIVTGAESPVAEPASVVNIPVQRMLLAHLASPSTLWLLAYLVAVVVAGVFGTWWALVGFVPGLIAFGAYYVRSVFKTLRYSIAPTPDGVRVTFGLTTTITEIIPPGRIHALEISQSIFWRPMGWWRIRINRMSGRSAQQQQQADPFTLLLPVGTREDVIRVLHLVFPNMSDADLDAVFEQGLLGPRPGDRFVNTPSRARLFRPFSWRRNGVLVTEDFVLMRRGVVWRQLALFPLVRAQGITIRQGPVDRALSVGGLQIDTVPGAVSGAIGIIDRDDLLRVFVHARTAAAEAARRDRTHRWAESALDGGTRDSADRDVAAEAATSSALRAGAAHTTARWADVSAQGVGDGAHAFGAPSSHVVDAGASGHEVAPAPAARVAAPEGTSPTGTPSTPASDGGAPTGGPESGAAQDGLRSRGPGSSTAGTSVVARRAPLPGEYPAPVIPAGGVAEPETVVLGEPGAAGVVLSASEAADSVAGPDPEPEPVDPTGGVEEPEAAALGELGAAGVVLPASEAADSVPGAGAPDQEPVDPTGGAAEPEAAVFGEPGAAGERAVGAVDPMSDDSTSAGPTHDSETPADEERTDGTSGDGESRE